MITFAYSDNSEAVAKSLAGFQNSLSDQMPALREIADDFREMVAHQFASEGRAEGTPWAERKSPFVGADGVRPSRGARPLRGERRSPLLVRTGALRDSLTRKGSAGQVEDLGRRELSVGSRLPYALFHQLGTRRMPARPIVVLSDARAAKWIDFVRGEIERKALLLGATELGGKG